MGRPPSVGTGVGNWGAQGVRGDNRALRSVPVRLNVDPGGNGFQLADPFLQVRQFDSARCRGKSLFANVACKLEPLEVQPGLLSLETGDACQAHGEKDAGPDQCDGHRFHCYFTSLKASISRARSSLWLLR